jgi:hypothetical protein
VLAFLPVDADMVVGVDVAALRGSALWAEYQGKLTDAAGPQLANVQKTCGFDPLQSVSSVTLAAYSKDMAGAVAVVRGLDRDRTIACLQNKVVPDVTVASDHGVVTLTHTNGSRDVLSFADSTTLVLQGAKASAQPTPDQLRAVMQAGVPLRSSPTFLDMFNRLEKGATMWMVVNGNASAFDKLGMATRPRAIYGTLRAADGLSGKVHIRMPTADDAKQLTGMAQAQIQQAAAMFDQLDVAAEGEVMTVTVALSMSKLRSMVQMMSMMFGGAGSP